MIDLISHGMALRKKITIPLEDPQELRSNSAGVTPYLAKDSAGSAESATRDNKDRNYCVCHSESIPSAESADIAEHQSQQGNFIADDLRKDCGLNPVNTLSCIGNPKNSLAVAMVTCNTCEHFTSDKVGDGTGIGECYLGVKWTQEFDGRRPLYRYAERHCVKFSKLMN